MKSCFPGVWVFGSLSAMTIAQEKQRMGLGVLCGLLVCGLLLQTAKGEEGYEAGRGLITLEGPSGLFINPTSATLPKDAGTAQYCVFFPNNKTDVVGHGLIGAFGLADNFEVGAQGTILDLPNGKERFAAGPFARYRLLKNDGVTPQVSVGAYSRLGDHALNKGSVFLAAYNRIAKETDCPLKSLGIHYGVRETWTDQDGDQDADDDSVVGYAGLEVQLPLRIYGVGEISTKDSDVHQHTPFAYGLQWRAAGIAMSIAGIQDGNRGDPSFYFGIGYGAQF